MDVREKLVELLGNIYLPITCGPDTIGEYRIPHKFKKEIADHLIAHGVTVQDNTEISDELLKQLRNAPLTVLHEEPTIEVVQEWISVKDERKPKVGEDVLVVVFDGYDTYTDTDCLMRDGKWCFETENHKVTHWQPMPQPPKGE